MPPKKSDAPSKRAKEDETIRQTTCLFKGVLEGIEEVIGELIRHEDACDGEFAHQGVDWAGEVDVTTGEYDV